LDAAVLRKVAGLAPDQAGDFPDTRSTTDRIPQDPLLSVHVDKGNHSLLENVDAPADAEVAFLAYIENVAAAAISPASGG